MTANIRIQATTARVVSSLAASLVLFLSAAHAIQSDRADTSPLREADFRRVTQAHTAAPSDPFRAEPDPKDFIGRSFELMVRPVRYSSSQCDSGATWRYDADKKELMVLYSFGTFVMPDLKRADGRAFDGLTAETDLQRYVSAACSRQVLPSYRASNAFGATVSISRSKQTLIALAENGREWGAASPKIHPTILVWRQKIEPETARAILPHLRVRLFGEIGRWSSGRVMLCGRVEDRPDLAHPMDDRLSGCFFSAKLQTLGMVDERSGKSLGSLEDISARIPDGYVTANPGFP